MTAIVDGPPLADLRDVSTAATPQRVFTDQYVGEWPSTAIYVDADTPAGGTAQRVVATWATRPGDQAHGRAIAVRDFLFAPNAIAMSTASQGFGSLAKGGLIVPNVGPFLTLEIDNAGGAGTATLNRVAAWGTIREPGSFNPSDPLAGSAHLDVLADLNAFAAGANATTNQLCNFWYTGWAQLWGIIGTPTGSSRMTILTLANDRSVFVVDQTNVSNVEQQRRIWIPPRPCWVECANTTAASVGFFMTLQPDW